MPESKNKKQSSGAKNKLLRVQVMIFLGFLVVLAWGSMAYLDIVVSARGEIVSTTDMEKIQHREGGILDTLFVKEGDYVHQGQAIARLTALERDSQLGTTHVEMTELRLEIERIRAFLDSAVPDFAEHTDDASLIAFHQNIWEQERAKNAANDALFEHDIEHKQELIASMRKRVRSSEGQLGLIQEQKNIKEQLYKESIIPYLDVLDMRVQESNMLREIQNLHEAILNEEFGLKKTKKQLNEGRSKRRADYFDALTKAEKDLKIKQEQLPNISDQVDRLTIYSPIDGYVNELHYNYKSAVISPGESIADISPIRSGLIAEAKIPRKDVGFVEIGQDVRVKMDTFAFTKYGSLRGQITAISKNSYEEKESEFYIAKINLDRDYLESSGVQYHIAPDMEFVADIKTGSRQVLDYALKPIMIALEQSFRER